MRQRKGQGNKSRSIRESHLDVIQKQNADLDKVGLEERRCPEKSQGVEKVTKWLAWVRGPSPISSIGISDVGPSFGTMFGVRSAGDSDDWGKRWEAATETSRFVSGAAVAKSPWMEGSVTVVISGAMDTGCVAVDE